MIPVKVMTLPGRVESKVMISVKVMILVKVMTLGSTILVKSHDLSHYLSHYFSQKVI